MWGKDLKNLDVSETFGLLIFLLVGIRGCKQGKHQVARFHDESYLNLYFLNHHPTATLHPGYIWPGLMGIPNLPVKIETVKKTRQFSRFGNLNQLIKKLY